jgi:hypothetical protein
MDGVADGATPAGRAGLLMPLFDWVQGLRLGMEIGQRLLRETERYREDAAGEASDAPLTPDQEELVELLAHRVEREATEEAKLERTRWLEEHRAERTFPCGVVPEPLRDGLEPDPAPGSAGAPGTAATPHEPEPRRPLLPSDPGWAAPDPPVVTPSAPPTPAAEPAQEEEERVLSPLRAMQVIAAVLPTDLVFIRERGVREDIEEVGRLPRSSIREVDVIDPGGVHVPEPVRETIEPSQPVFAVLRWSNGGTPDEDRFLFRSRWQAWQAAHRLRDAKR